MTPTPTTNLTQISDLANGYLQLGVAGAALFILVLFVMAMFRNNNRVVTEFAKINSSSINQLCVKIEKLAETNTDMAKALIASTTKNVEDQNNNSRMLLEILDHTQDNGNKIENLAAKVDGLVNLKCKPNSQ
jgi:uncharacterized membrane protein YhiD involved in acid resistance